MENLKQSVNQYSKKSSIKARFLSKKAQKSTVIANPNTSTKASLTATEARPNSQLGTDSILDNMVLSVLDLFPDMQKDFIKVKRSTCIIILEKKFLREF